MNPERIPDAFPGNKKAQEEALQINEIVDEYYERPRTDKSRPTDEVAHEAIKDRKNRPVTVEHLSQQEQTWFENLDDSGVSILTDGWVEVTRWDKQPGKRMRPLRQKVDGINSAIRMQDHILEGYDVNNESEEGEFKQLESIQEVIERANELLRNWRMASDEEKELMQQEIAHVIMQLENCRNEFKVGTKEQAEEVLTLKDSQGRVNPSAMAARTIGALNAIGKRFNELQAIAPLIALRKELLVLERRRSEVNINKAATYVSGVLHHAVFNATARKSPDELIRPDEVEFLERDLNKALHYLDKVFCAPYKQQADQARFDIISKIKKNLSSKKNFVSHLDDVRDALRDAHEILRSDMSEQG